MDLYESFDGGGGRVHIYVFPFVIVGDQGFAPRNKNSTDKYTTCT
jgi:hypothetical protein